jgi:hypothetical protein
VTPSAPTRPNPTSAPVVRPGKFLFLESQSTFAQPLTTREMSSPHVCVVRILSIEERFTSFAKLLSLANAKLRKGRTVSSSVADIVNLVRLGVTWVGVFNASQPWSAVSSRETNARTVRFENAIAYHLSALPAVDILSAGCGCGGLLHSSHTSTTLSLASIDPRCRRSLRRYAWALGCADIAAQWTVECSGLAAANRAEASLSQSKRAGTGHEVADIPASPLKDMLHSVLPKLSHCSNMRALFEVRCPYFAARLKALRDLALNVSDLNVMDKNSIAESTALASFRSSRFRASERAGRISSLQESVENAHVDGGSPQTVGLLVAGGAGGIVFHAPAQAQLGRRFEFASHGFNISGGNHSHSLGRTAFSVRAIVPEWEGGGAGQRVLCMLGAPPSPRQLTAGVGLSDGCTFVLFGGRGERAGNALRHNLQGFSDRALSPATFADTFVLAVQPDNTFAALGLPVSSTDGLAATRCDADASQQEERLQSTANI